MPADLLIVSPLMRPFMEDLASRYRLHKYYKAEDKSAFLAGLPPVRALVTAGGVGLSGDIVRALPALELAATMSVGYDTIDLPALTAQGAVLTNTPDVLNDDVADTAIALMLCAWRDMMRGDAHVRSGAWGRDGAMPLNHRIAGARVGIVGLGRIGSAIAERLVPMRCDLAYFGRTQKPVDWRFEPDLVALAGWADILIVAAAGGTETAGLISADVIAALGPRGCLVNIARGSVVVEPALLDALESGALGMAGLDVFASEPNPDPRFSALANVVLHPHHAAGTVETRDAMAQLVVDNIDAFFAGRPLLSPVTP